MPSQARTQAAARRESEECTRSFEMSIELSIGCLPDGEYPARAKRPRGCGEFRVKRHGWPVPARSDGLHHRKRRRAAARYTLRLFARLARGPEETLTHSSIRKNEAFNDSSQRVHTLPTPRWCGTQWRRK